MTGPPDTLERLLRQGYRYAFSLTHHKEDAEDLLQEAWLAVYHAKGPQNKGYLFRAIRTRFLNRVKRHGRVTMQSFNETDFSEPEKSALTPVDQQWMNQQETAAALACLRVVEREALYLNVVEGYTAKEIAALTGQPRSTVLSLIHRARHKIRQYAKNKIKKVKP